MSDASLVGPTLALALLPYMTQIRWYYERMLHVICPVMKFKVFCLPGKMDII